MQHTNPTTTTGTASETTSENRAKPAHPLCTIHVVDCNHMSIEDFMAPIVEDRKARGDE